MTLCVARTRLGYLKPKGQIRRLNTKETGVKCIELMRKTAQPVSVATVIVPPCSRDASTLEYHGATLSSFTSVAMHPYPIVSFALRTPSRMADIFRRQTIEAQNENCRLTPHMVINLLSSSMADIAIQFSLPRAKPFGSSPYFLGKDNIPILRGSLGALSCVLLQTIPLNEQHFDEPVMTGHGEQGSELFLARVLRVEEGYPSSDGLNRQPERPLVYHWQRYTTVVQKFDDGENIS